MSHYNNEHKVFNDTFSKHLSVKVSLQPGSTKSFEVNKLQQAMKLANILPCPYFIIARKQKYYWRINNRLFDYEGKYRKAHELK
ncbi:hypothetical protein [Colwellia psychrerythraea]|uniref:Uncharacterized protein n=1 Tax=Colwellia psychrerythraea TaxID=28229 RepID=A0A099L220_COLPS|nr:hypothetical protein [Colwellia psychrerythraea]KGJ95928.1 hypothetical protein GAB14E_1840 [Colwellia psychrerythraea]